MSKSTVSKVQEATARSHRRRKGEEMLKREIRIISGPSQAGNNADEKCDDDSGAPVPFFVLVGGEAYESQGCEPARRELMHTSVNFVGEAYAELRSCGIPRSQIITIVQLSDYLDVLDQGSKGAFRSNGLPPSIYAEVAEQTRAKSALLLEEGGADYDGTAVNPYTVWCCMLGKGDGKVVRGSSSIFP